MRFAVAVLSWLAKYLLSILTADCLPHNVQMRDVEITGFRRIFATRIKQKLYCIPHVEVKILLLRLCNVM